MNMKNYYLNSSIITIIAVLFVLFIVAGCSVLLQKQVDLKQSQLNPISSIDTSTWKTYRNEQYGFEFKYPASWKRLSTAEYRGDLARALLASPDFQTEGESAILASSVKFGQELLFTAISTTVARDILSESLRQEGARQIAIGGSEGVFYKTSGGDIFSRNLNLDVNFTAPTQGDRLLSFSLTGLATEQEKNESIFKTILSTFKFIEPLTGVSNASWYQCTQDSDCTAVYALNDVCQNNCPSNAISRSYLSAYNQERAKQVQLIKQQSPGVACPVFPPPSLQSCLQSFPAKCVAEVCKIIQL